MTKFTEDHSLDVDGNPAGGESSGVGVNVRWQNGPLGRDEDRVPPNGAFVETLIAIVLGRLNFYQTASDGRFKCRENALAITKLEEALHWLDHRTRERESRQVEGTHTV